MAIDPYESCPCGSGKNFKWCCQPYFGLVEKALSQNAEGQHEAALRTIDQLVAQHPDSAPVWGYKAQLLYLNGKGKEAEEAIDKALSLNPDFAFGYMLRGLLRQSEGEVIGALLLFRKAADLYDPKAHDQLAQLYEMIAENELRLNRPVAARAALERAARYDPANEEIRQVLEAIFGPESRLPESARRKYSFRPAAPDRAAAWRAALPGGESARLGDALRAFEKLTQENDRDAAAWFNLGLVRAWLGENAPGIEDLNRYVELEPDEARAAEAAALAEVLRCGHGAEEQADHLEHRAIFRLRDPQPVVQMLEGWDKEHRMLGVRSNPEDGSLVGLLLEPPSGVNLTGGPPMAKLAAHLFIVANLMRLANSQRESLERAVDEVRQKLGPAIDEPHIDAGPVQFGDVVAEALVFPTQPTTPEAVQPRMRDHAERFFEDTWIHRPLKALAGNAPVDAAGHPNLRKRLLGVIRFLDECFSGSAPRMQDPGADQTPLYDFDRLRRKLGLTEGAPPAAQTAAATATAAASGPDVNAMGAAELAGLNAGTLSDEQLEQAFRAALRLDARDLAASFARALVARPANAAQPDRYPFYKHLMDVAHSENDTDAVLRYLEEGRRIDAEQNEGRRANDYGLRRGQTLAKRKEVDAAAEEFQSLINRAPDDLRFYGTAAEAMLGQRQGQRALQFAEAGLAKARRQNNRDSEQYFMELVGAAKKQVG